MGGRERLRLGPRPAVDRASHARRSCLATHALLGARAIYEHIPGAPRAHGSTICELSSGRLMAAWYAGSAEGDPDVAIYGAYCRPGRDWGPPFVLEKTPGCSEGNPVLHPRPHGGVTLCWVTMYERGWSGCRIRIRDAESRGGERLWGADRVFSDELGLMTRNKPIVMSNGELLLPLYDERAWRSFFAWSADGGRTWECGALLPSEPGNIQPTVVEAAPGRLLALFRTGARQDGTLWRSASDDYGRTWSPLEATDIPNPNSGADMVRLSSGTVLLVYNDAPRGRTPLTVAVSTDECRSFASKRNLEDAAGEYSYPAAIQGRDGAVHVTYTYRRETIKHVTVREDWVRGVS